MAAKRITINKKTAQFFISINKQGAHSFVMLGVYDQNKVQHILCRVGKLLHDETYHERNKCSATMGFWGKALFSTNEGRLVDEKVSRKYLGATPISYHASDISFVHYIEFVRILEALQTQDNKFKCFKPESEQDDKITLLLTDSILCTPKADVDKIKDSVYELHIGNTCRHSAITLVEEVQQVPVSSKISENFIQQLPYKTRLEYGSPSASISFYVLPVSPNAYPELDETKMEIATKLYKRMEQMLLLDPNSKRTQDKFSILKNLYVQIIGPQKELSLDQLLERINAWKQEHYAALIVMRKKYLWDFFVTRTSATSTMVDEITHTLQNTIH